MHCVQFIRERFVFCIVAFALSFRIIRILLREKQKSNCLQMLCLLCWYSQNACGWVWIGSLAVAVTASTKSLHVQISVIIFKKKSTVDCAMCTVHDNGNKNRSYFEFHDRRSSTERQTQKKKRNYTEKCWDIWWTNIAIISSVFVLLTIFFRTLFEFNVILAENWMLIF